MLINLDERSNAIKILSTQSRRADLSPIELSRIHRTLGRLLSYEYVNFLKLEEIEIEHVQGKKFGKDICKNDFTLVLTLMRSGLFVAEGFIEILNNHARLEFLNNERELELLLDQIDCRNLNVVLVDSVINTGETVCRMLETLPECKSITCVCQVMQASFAKTIRDVKDVLFLACRVSQNFYVGKGKTDTGNRLLGHFPSK